MSSGDAIPPTLPAFVRANFRSFIPGLSYALMRVVVIAPFPIIFKQMIDVQMPRGDVRGIALLSGLMVVLLVLHHVLSVRGGEMLGRAVVRVILRLRATVFERVGTLSFSYLDRQKSGRLLAKYLFDTQKIDGVIFPVLNGFLPNSLYSLLTLSILIAMNWQLSAVIVLMLPILAFMRGHYFEQMRQRNNASRLATERLSGVASELLGALRLVRSYGCEGRAGRQLAEADAEVAQARVRAVHVSSSFGSFSWGSIQFLSLVVVAGGAVLSIYGQVTAGTVLAFVAGLGPLVQPIQMFAGMADQYFVGREAYASIRELLDSDDMERWRGRRTLEPLRGRIEFEDVCFRYPGATADALHRFSLTIEAGESVALVGASGSGKSTIVSLLLGLYAVDSGTIRIDGVPQGQLDMRWLRRHTAIVMQDNVLLSGTIADNLRFAREDATDEELRLAARRANAEAFIDAMPNGFDTLVGERGVMLSGGQRQRLAIARGLLRDPAILILDEPTSALDYESERLIQEALDALARERTTITIAHRLSTIRNADRVVVLEAGRIAEQGTFAELWRAQGAFHRMLEAAGGGAAAGSAAAFEASEPGGLGRLAAAAG